MIGTQVNALTMKLVTSSIKLNVDGYRSLCWKRQLWFDRRLGIGEK